jgi:hypothetical protein
MSFTTSSAGAFVVTGVFIFFNANWDEDDPQTRHDAITLNYPIGAEGR